MRILVTGSSGYLASLLLPHLAAEPGVERLLGLDVAPPRAAPSGFVHHPGSVLDPDLTGLLTSEAIDLIIHLAWVFNPSHDREAMRRIDVDGSRNVFESAAAAGVQHVVHLSSTTAYGAHADNPQRLAESAPARGNEGFPYAADKAAVERFLDTFEPLHPELGISRVRPCIVLGARTDNFVRSILDLPVLLRLSGYDPALQFLHEDDLADALLAVVRTRPRGAINIAPREGVRFSELGALLGRPSLAVPERLLRALVALGWRTRLLPTPPSYLDFVKWPWLADVQEMTQRLGFTPRHSSREALIATRRSPGTAGGPL